MVINFDVNACVWSKNVVIHYTMIICVEEIHLEITAPLVDFKMTLVCRSHKDLFDQNLIS